MHSRRPGRLYGDIRDVDDYRRGVQNLRNGKLSKWAAETTYMRSIRHPPARGASSKTPQEDSEMAGEGDIDNMPVPDTMEVDDENPF